MDQLIEDIDRYYTRKLSAHGATPAGVDWNGEESQFVRFRELARILQPQDGLVINDLGCGYGSLIDYLEANGFGPYRYRGYDVSSEMIARAKQRYGETPHAAFFRIQSAREMQPADYTLGSGIFNVKMHYPDAAWLAHILETLAAIDKASRKGFAFNILTRYSDKEYLKAHLYYADPCFFFDYCKRHYARNVALLHDYGLYEFTLLVRKQV